MIQGLQRYASSATPPSEVKPRRTEERKSERKGFLPGEEFWWLVAALSPWMRFTRLGGKLGGGFGVTSGLKFGHFT